MNNINLAKRAFARLADNFHERDHRPFYDLLAEDVVMKYGHCREGTPLSGEHRGKQAVIEFAFSTSPQLIEDHRLEGELDYIGSADCVVVLGAETYKIKKTGVTVRNREFAVVLDFRNGLITRMLQIKDLSEFMDAYATPTHGRIDCD